MAFSPATLHAAQERSSMTILPQLYYRSGGGWTALPYWSQFFIELGATFATCHSNSYRLVAGLAVPTRAFAASLTAVGAVTISAIANRFTSDDIARHIERFHGLKPDVPLVYRKRNNSLQKCTFDGFCIHNGEPCLRIRIEQAGKSTVTLPSERLLGVDTLSDEMFKLPRHQAIRRIVSDDELAFLSACIGDACAYEHIACSRLECLVIGPVEQIRQEVKETQFAAELADSTFIEGSLNMLGRMRSLLTDCSAYRSDICSPVNTSENLISLGTPHLVVFAGAAGFLKWRDLWRRSHWAVILDRTETHFEEAVAELNQEYIRRRADAKLPSNLPYAPSGIETVWYQEAL
jgi:hypothetical protein